MTMTQNEKSIERIADSLEKISEEGIHIYLHHGTDHMALDMAAMKISDGLEDISAALYDAAYKEEKEKGKC